VLTNVLHIGIEARKHKDPAIRKLPSHVSHQRQSVAARHCHIAEQKIRAKLPRTLKRFIRRIGRPRPEAISLEDEGERVGNQTIIINY
jgi:hypothetical protein